MPTQPCQTSTTPTPSVSTTTEVDNSQKTEKALPTSPFIAGLMEDALSRKLETDRNELEEKFPDDYNDYQKQVKTAQEEYHVKNWTPPSARFVVKEYLHTRLKMNLLQTLAYNLGRFTHLLLSLFGLPFFPKWNLAYYLLDRGNLERHTSPEVTAELHQAYLDAAIYTIKIQGIEQQLQEIGEIAKRYHRKPQDQIRKALPGLFRKSASDAGRLYPKHVMKNTFAMVYNAKVEMELPAVYFDILHAHLMGDSDRLIEVYRLAKDRREQVLYSDDSPGDPLDDLYDASAEKNPVRARGIMTLADLKFTLDGFAPEDINSKEASDVFKQLDDRNGIKIDERWTTTYGNLASLLRTLREMHREIKDSLYNGDKEKVLAIAEVYKKKHGIDISGLINKAFPQEDEETKE